MAKIDKIATAQMKEIWDEHHDAEIIKEKELKKRREERRENKKKDLGL